MSFTIHYYSTKAAYGLVLLGIGIAVICLILAYRAKMRNYDPRWYLFSAMAFFIATILGAILGDANFNYYMKTYYDVENLNTYPSVNPTVEPGQQLMDVGRFYFETGTRLDLKMSAAFKNSDVYCVTPIVSGDKKLDSYDYWAIGLNCCSEKPSDYHCGEYDNPLASAGMRLMRDDQRPFFRMAIQQAEAAFNIRAQHPLLLYWLEDPIAEMNSYHLNGFRFYLLGILMFFMVNCCIVGCAVSSFSKMDTDPGYITKTVFN